MLIKHLVTPYGITRPSWNKIRDHFVYAASLLEPTLQCNVVSHWLATYTKWSLKIVISIPADIYVYSSTMMSRSIVQGGAVKMQSIFPNSSQKTPHSLPVGRGMGCLLWVQTLIYILPHHCNVCNITVLHIFRTTDRTSCPNWEKSMGHGSWLHVLKQQKWSDMCPGEGCNNGTIEIWIGTGYNVQHWYHVI